MATDTTEPTRSLGQPLPGGSGTLHTKTVMSPKACRVRARLDVPPSKVMPIIVVPGIMGTNLRASTQRGTIRNRILKPGEAAWRPPNGLQKSGVEVWNWSSRSPAVRQMILDGDTLEVDPSGEIELPSMITANGMNADLARDYGWGEIHWDSYGPLLTSLRWQFSTFLRCSFDPTPAISGGWSALNLFDRKLWPRNESQVLKPFELAEIEKLAENWYPVYAIGYNWLQSNERSADMLAHRIEQIIEHWSTQEFDCRRVVVVTHSMGGLVARACAKKIPDKIAGVVHVCMPALGAPVCYRRIACGTEKFSPTNGKLDNSAAAGFAKIAGATAAETNAVMCFSPGALELLPNHLYPRPWLFASKTGASKNAPETLRLPPSNPYDMYRDTKAWYRIFDPVLLDPAKLSGGKHIEKMVDSVNQAQRFHESVLDTYYHPNTFAFHGADAEHSAYGSFTWTTKADLSGNVASLGAAELTKIDKSGARTVKIAQSQEIVFEPSFQDQAGDGTVPSCSGQGVKGTTKENFRLGGIGHQNVFKMTASRALTLQLLARAILAS